MASGTLSIDSLVNAPRVLLAPLPTFVLQPALRRIALKLFRGRPELGERLGEHRCKHFLIDPLNLPFVFVLRPDPDDPLLRAVRRGREPAHDARIAGTFLSLLDMVDGRLDGDALFFSRALQVTGDTEAVVSLRNALDDAEGSLADDVAALHGPPGRLVLQRLRAMRTRGTRGV
ncbi:MAG TPA: SCP2 sterol-binding domain-containing protein [Arenicellales bacterium]|nr:SCP2 sterol-binding domain-containing protein [Arenicellales bacterium]